MKRLAAIGFVSLLAALPNAFGADHKHAPLPDKLGRVHTTRSASTISANERNPREEDVEFFKAREDAAEAFESADSRSISLRFL